jgi:demethylmenaquinone methyltransferase / 2-methoxy-6-polyprenyl-1,4-benzoquinol methylase
MTRSPNHDVAKMFDRISRTYDFLNHFFSLNIDRRWRNAAVRGLELAPQQLILDCSAGTGDMALTVHQHVAGACTVLLDPAHAMLNVADAKAGVIAPKQFRLVRGCAEGIPFADHTFDRFMVAFGVRNFADLPVGLRELQRILKPGGCGAILEFTPDRSRAIDAIFRFYMRRIMGPIGALISGDRVAYRYLSATVQRFATSQELTGQLRAAGFTNIEIRKLAYGIATLFILHKQ